MAKKKSTITKSMVISPTKVQPVWQIGMLFPNGQKIAKPKCTLNEIFETYFLNLDKYVGKDITAEDLLNKYKDTFESKGIKVQINYIDSWGHTWKGKVAWPRESKFIEYLNKRLNND
jgi:hypothetical protein